MAENSCLTDMQIHKEVRARDRERKMPIVPLEKTIMIDKMRLLKRTQWSLIDSLGKEENELISRE